MILKHVFKFSPWDWRSSKTKWKLLACCQNNTITREICYIIANTWMILQRKKEIVWVYETLTEVLLKYIEIILTLRHIVTKYWKKLNYTQVHTSMCRSLLPLQFALSLCQDAKHMLSRISLVCSLLSGFYTTYRSQILIKN